MGRYARQVVDEVIAHLPALSSALKCELRTRFRQIFQEDLTNRLSGSK
jgi:hypothetical protein